MEVASQPFFEVSYLHIALKETLRSPKIDTRITDLYLNSLKQRSIRSVPFDIQVRGSGKGRFQRNNRPGVSSQRPRPTYRQNNRKPQYGSSSSGGNRTPAFNIKNLFNRIPGGGGGGGGLKGGRRPQSGYGSSKPTYQQQQPQQQQQRGKFRFKFPNLGNSGSSGQHRPGGGIKGLLGGLGGRGRGKNRRPQQGNNRPSYGAPSSNTNKIPFLSLGGGSGGGKRPRYNGNNSGGRPKPSYNRPSSSGGGGKKPFLSITFLPTSAPNKRPSYNRPSGGYKRPSGGGGRPSYHGSNGGGDHLHGSSSNLFSAFLSPFSSGGGAHHGMHGRPTSRPVGSRFPFNLMTMLGINFAGRPGSYRPMYNMPSVQRPSTPRPTMGAPVRKPQMMPHHPLTTRPTEQTSSVTTQQEGGSTRPKPIRQQVSPAPTTTGTQQQGTTTPDQPLPTYQSPTSSSSTSTGTTSTFPTSSTFSTQGTFLIAHFFILAF